MWEVCKTFIRSLLKVHDKFLKFPDWLFLAESYETMRNGQPLKCQLATKSTNLKVNTNIKRPKGSSWCF